MMKTNWDEENYSFWVNFSALFGGGDYSNKLFTLNR